MKLAILILTVLFTLPLSAEETKPSKPRAGQSSGNTSAPTNYSSNQTQNSFANDVGVMP